MNILVIPPTDLASVKQYKHKSLVNHIENCIEMIQDATNVKVEAMYVYDDPDAYSLLGNSNIRPVAVIPVEYLEEAGYEYSYALTGDDNLGYIEVLSKLSEKVQKEIVAITNKKTAEAAVKRMIKEVYNYLSENMKVTILIQLSSETRVKTFLSGVTSQGFKIIIDKNYEAKYYYNGLEISLTEFKEGVSLCEK